MSLEKSGQNDPVEINAWHGLRKFTEARIALACLAVRESVCDFIKTSTGFHPAGGATVEAVRLMKKHGEGIKVKAAGGIRDLATSLAMIDAGADRLGMSASVAVVGELRARQPMVT